MKILFITRRFYPHIGGVEKHIYRVSQELMEHGHDVTIITEDHRSGRGDSVDDVDGIAVHYKDLGADTWFKKFRMWWSMLRNWSLVQKSDVVHLHDTFFWYAPLAFLMPWKPFYITFHGYEGIMPPAQNAVRIRRIANAMAEGSVQVGDYIQKWYGTVPNEVIYGAVDQHKMKSTIHKPLRILLLGRLAPDIGIEKYLQLLKALEKSKVKFQLTVCGDGPYRKRLEKFGEVKGFVDHVNPYIQSADVVFSASYLSILEALSYGKHIVALYEHDMKKDILEMTPFRDYICITDSIDEATKFVANLKKRSKSDINRIEKFITSVSWEAIADTYERLWKK